MKGVLAKLDCTDYACPPFTGEVSLFFPLLGTQNPHPKFIPIPETPLQIVQVRMHYAQFLLRSKRETFNPGQVTDLPFLWGKVHSFSQMTLTSQLA